MVHKKKRDEDRVEDALLVIVYVAIACLCILAISATVITVKEIFGL